jgi:hypothetical protein
MALINIVYLAISTFNLGFFLIYSNFMLESGMPLKSVSEESS